MNLRVTVYLIFALAMAYMIVWEADQAQAADEVPVIRCQQDHSGSKPNPWFYGDTHSACEAAWFALCDGFSWCVDSNPYYNETHCMEQNPWPYELPGGGLDGFCNGQGRGGIDGDSTIWFNVDMNIHAGASGDGYCDEGDYIDPETGECLPDGPPPTTEECQQRPTFSSTGDPIHNPFSCFDGCRYERDFEACGGGSGQCTNHWNPTGSLCANPGEDVIEPDPDMGCVETSGLGWVCPEDSEEGTHGPGPDEEEQTGDYDASPNDNPVPDDDNLRDGCIMHPDGTIVCGPGHEKDSFDGSTVSRGDGPDYTIHSDGTDIKEGTEIFNDEGDEVGEVNDEGEVVDAEGDAVDPEEANAPDYSPNPPDRDGDSPHGPSGGTGNDDDDQGDHGDGQGNDDGECVDDPTTEEDECGDGSGREAGLGGCSQAPVCDGDPIDCAVVQLQWETACWSREPDGGFDGLFADLEPEDDPTDETVDLEGFQADQAGFGFPRSCPVDIEFTIGSVVIPVPLSAWCPFLDAAGVLVLLIAGFLSFRIVAEGFA